MAYDQFGRVIRSAPAPQIPSSQNSYSFQNSSSFTNFGTYSYRESLWTRIDDAIRTFGNWFDEVIPTISSWITTIATLIGAIGLIMFVFKDWNLFYMIFRFFGACIMGYIGLVIIGINTFILGLGLKILRFCFWNAYTLILAIAIVAGVGIYSYANTPHYAAPIAYEERVKLTVTHEVTAYELNVRASNSKYSDVVGKLHKGDRIEVFDTTNGFATIDYNGQRCYVSEKYIQRIQ